MQALEAPLTSFSAASSRGVPRSEHILRTRGRRTVRCSRAGLERVLGLTIKAVLLTAQRVLDLLALWRITRENWTKHGGRFKEEDWWFFAVGVLATTALSAVALSRHRCALRKNRPYGWGWATAASVLQLTAVVEMVDKLGDGFCWGVAETISFRPASEMKGSRYGENLMRGLRKLSIASLPMILLSTSVHLTRLWHVVLGKREGCDRVCEVEREVGALVVGIVCLANACSDLVLYIWVDDVYVKRHKKLVQLHYFLELLAREPILFLFNAVMKPVHGVSPLFFLYAADVLADVLLLILPTLRTCARGRLSVRHGLSQVSTAVFVSQLLFGMNVTFFDPRDVFLVLNAGFYLVKILEVIVMLQLLNTEVGGQHFFQFFFWVQLGASLTNAALVWIIVPWSHRAMDAHMLRSPRALPRLRALLPNTDAPATRARTTSVFSHLGADLPVRDRELSLELGTVGAPQAAAAKINASLIGEDSNLQLELLGDILEALCLLSQTQSVRNRPVLSRTMVVNILWSLVLPCQGDYDDGSGGRVVLSTLDPERGAILLRHSRPEEQAGRSQPSCPSSASAETAPSSDGVMESIGLVFHGTAVEVTWPGEGRVFGIFDGAQIRFSDQRQTVWTRLGSGPSCATAGAQEVLRLVLMQLLLALRWEPTFLGLGPGAASVADRSLAAVDASQRPLLCFLVRYALASRDTVLVSELYWSLWCLSQDPQDGERSVYDKARWALVTALQGGIEFWDGDHGLRLDNPVGVQRATVEAEAFRHEALELLVRHGALWRQTVLLARLGIDVQGDSAERTRCVRQKLHQWHAERRGGVRGSLELLLATEDPYLIDVGVESPLNCTSLTEPSGFVSLPVDPGVRFLGLEISSCEILASNASPLLLSCLRGPPTTPSEASQASSESQVEPALNAQKYMVKVGDDLRQDQLVLQLLGLMERVWQERLPACEHEMLRLAPYRVLAMTPSAGYVKFVPGAVSLSKALHRSRGDFTAWLDANRPSTLPLADALKNLCGSVAAYCVATYCLGIGDRHLDNLQITPEGFFFHIDFGFIFGDDPKPFAPRLRLPQPVATALHAAETGTAGETLLGRCFLLAGRAYIALRRSMPLWVSLLRVTGQAGGAGCQRLQSNADAAVVMIRDRLRSDLGSSSHEEETAVSDFLLVLYESTEALYPIVTDKVHQLGLFWK